MESSTTTLGRRSGAGRELMRLPADATLIVAGEAPEGAAGENVAALIAAWRAEGLPVVHVDRDGREGDNAALHERLDALGTTTIVLCGEGQGLVAAAVAAADMGCHVFIAGDACAAPALAPILADEDFSSDDRARLVSAEAALAAASTAKVRQRRDEARRARS